MTTVLVADDSATVRALVGAVLEGAGYAVVEAGDGEQALVAAREHEVDVLLLDVEMPVLDGFGTIAALKQDETTQDLPVVFLTSRDSGEDVVEALRLGAHDFLSKPPEPAELLARVGAAVEVSGLRRELRRRTDELDRASRTDHLTGLLNRRALDLRLQELVTSTREHRFPVTVLLVDVDHFKAVNDELGHQVGDDVLVEVARRMSSCLRGDDVVGRWGGEEFLVVAEQAGVEGGTALAERLRGLVASSPVCERAVTVSIGGATSRTTGATVGDVLRLADANLYDAKRSGRDRVRVTALA